jgi:hypothetical protein
MSEVTAEIDRLTAENEALRGERDRQYDENVELIVENEALRAVLAQAREVVAFCAEAAQAMDDAAVVLARIAALDVPAQQEDCPHCSCEDPTTTYVAETPEAEPEWVRIENEARARDGRPLHPGPIPRSAYKNNPYADD